MAPKRKLNRGLEALLGTGLLNKPDTDTETPRVTEGSARFERHKSVDGIAH